MIGYGKSGRAERDSSSDVVGCSDGWVFYFSVVVGQILGWIYLCPRSELLADAYWRHCLFLDCPK